MTEESLLRDLQTSTSRNVFVMMRYSDTPQLRSVENTIRQTLHEYGLIARLARDASVSDDLWENIQIYMESSQYGIAVFEEIDQRDFNPNVSLELGFMYARRRRCLLLKDRRMPRLLTDACGKIYREFDTYLIDTSIREQVANWCERDLGLTKRPEGLSSTTAPTQGLPERLIYDSAIDEGFTAWGRFDTSLSFSDHIKFVADDATAVPGVAQLLELHTGGSEAVGVNKTLKILRGTIEAEYCAISSSAAALNLFFCAIPMRAPLESLIEVGATRASEPENATSPYRVRTFIPHHQIGDRTWHKLKLQFDFSATPGAAYTIGAVRINEGCPRPGSATLRVRSVRVTTPEAE